MWHWDQGHLKYFQFDALRKIARFVRNNDFRTATRNELLNETGLAFRAPGTHSPWRNYSRTLKLALLVSKAGRHAEPTPVAEMLAEPGLVTCDEYLHFLVRAFTEPAPALAGWSRTARFRYPLLFSLKYLLTKAAIGETATAGIGEIISAYRRTNFVGDEDDSSFIRAVRDNRPNDPAGIRIPISWRQARESLLVIAQISYLHVRDNMITVSLNAADAREIFQDLTPIVGPRARNREAEIRRLAALFVDGSSDISFDYPNTVVNEIIESGFREGNKVKRTHVTIERNAALRKEFFRARPTAICDVCVLDTAQTYPWTNRILDVHHLLPLSSGTRVEAEGTTFDDLVPVCPSCHRAIHRYYDQWLAQNARNDFQNAEEAREVYQDMRQNFGGVVYG